jgi:pSer/pThr/pTyr-binding forkhead associated (FHA) protein
VDIRFDEEIAEITGAQGQVSGVVTNKGAHIPCEIVILAIGINPNIDFVKQSGITCGRGVKVDAGMRTSATDIYAAGDILETTDPITGHTRVIGQWYPAIQQARAAALSMLDVLDSSQPFRTSTFYNATFLYGLEFASVGLTQLPVNAQSYQEIVADPQPRTYRKAILKNGVLVGVLSFGDRKGMLVLKRAIDHGVNLSPVVSRLFASDFNLKAWLDAQGVPPPILGPNREGSALIRQVAYAEGTRRNATSSRQAQLLMEAWLVPTTTPQGAQATLVPETLLSETRVMTIGREAGVYLRIDDEMVSRRHAEISYVNAQYVLRDLGSVNGTLVNEIRLEPGSAHILQPGDRLCFGKNVTLLLQMHCITEQEKHVHQRTGTGSTPGINRPRGEATGMLAASLADEMQTRLDDLLAATQPFQPPGQPVFNADEAHTIPGVTNPIPINVVAASKEAPALILVMNGATEIFPLKPGKCITLGRERTNDIVLTDMMASRKHAEVYPAPDGYYIRDLDSSNGVMVNQARIDSLYHLGNGDCITIAQVSIYFVQQHTDSTRSSAIEVHCRNCGTELRGAARFCPACGTSTRLALGRPV